MSIGRLLYGLEKRDEQREKRGYENCEEICDCKFVKKRQESFSFYCMLGVTEIIEDGFLLKLTAFAEQRIDMFYHKKGECTIKKMKSELKKIIHNPIHRTP